MDGLRHRPIERLSLDKQLKAELSNVRPRSRTMFSSVGTKDDTDIAVVQRFLNRLM